MTTDRYERRHMQASEQDHYMMEADGWEVEKVSGEGLVIWRRRVDQ